ncbi:MAG: addiction module protein [Verrucomicrobia bacterium]|nr:addiction module protein [Verrucomicrobiota bacterium]
MTATLDPQQMTVSDKLRLMEDLGRNLSQNETDLPSPEWHGPVLEERERKLASGDDSLVDWETAKRQLRAKLR